MESEAQQRGPAGPGCLPAIPHRGPWHIEETFMLSKDDAAVAFEKVLRLALEKHFQTI